MMGIVASWQARENVVLARERAERAGIFEMSPDDKDYSAKGLTRLYVYGRANGTMFLGELDWIAEEMMVFKGLPRADASIRDELQRIAKGGRGRSQDECLVFGSRSGRQCPDDIWIRNGGSLADLGDGVYLKTDPGNPDCHWHEPYFEDATETPEFETEDAPGDGPDSFGRPRSGLSDSEVDAMLCSVKGEDGAVSLAAAAQLFGLRGSRPRDRRNLARVRLGQTGRFQSTREGRYYDTEDPRVPEGVLAELERLIDADYTAHHLGANKRLQKIRSQSRYKSPVRVPVGAEYGP